MYACAYPALRPSSVVTTVLYFWQPFVDHQAVMKWIVDNAFMGSIAACSIFGTFFSHKVSSEHSQPRDMHSVPRDMHSVELANR